MAGLLDAISAFTMLPGERKRIETKYNMENEQAFLKQALAEQAYRAQLQDANQAELERQKALNDMGDKDMMEALSQAYPESDPKFLLAQYKLSKPELDRSKSDTEIAKNLALQAEARGRLGGSEKLGSESVRADTLKNMANADTSTADMLEAGARKIWGPQAVGADLRAKEMEARRRTAIANTGLELDPQLAMSDFQRKTAENTLAGTEASAKTPLVPAAVKSQFATQQAQDAQARKAANFHSTALDNESPALAGQAADAAAQAEIARAKLPPLLSGTVKLPNANDMMALGLNKANIVTPQMLQLMTTPPDSSAINLRGPVTNGTPRTLYKFK